MFVVDRCFGLFVNIGGQVRILQICCSINLYKDCYMKSYFASILSLFLFISSAYAASEQEEQDQRKPKTLTQKEAKSLLMKLVKKVKGKNAKREELSQFMVGGKKYLSKSIKDQDREDKIVKQQCLADETQFQKIKTTLLKSWITSWKKKNTKEFSKLLTKKSTVSSFNNQESFRKIENMEVKVWKKGIDKTGKKIISTNVNNYLSEYTRIEDFDLVVKKMQPASAIS